MTLCGDNWLYEEASFNDVNVYATSKSSLSVKKDISVKFSWRIKVTCPQTLRKHVSCAAQVLTAT